MPRVRRWQLLEKGVAAAQDGGIVEGAEQMLLDAYGQGLFMLLLEIRYTYNAHAAKELSAANCCHEMLGQAGNAGEGLLSAI